MQTLTERLQILEQLSTNTSHQTCQSGVYTFYRFANPISKNSPSQHTVYFQQPYQTPPAVVIGTTMFDLPGNENVRLTIELESVTKEGFAIIARTWATSIIYSTGVYWMACPTS